MRSIDISPLVSAIYACAVDPSQWPGTLDKLADALNCHIGGFTVLDRMVEPPQLTCRFVSSRADKIWLDRHAAQNHAMEFIAFFEHAMAQTGGDPDAPLVISHVLGRDALDNLRVGREWAGPQGLCDCMSIVVHDAAAHFATVDLIRHESQGLIGTAEVNAMREIAPHLRRAVAISVLLDLKSLEDNTVSTTLESLTSAIVIVDKTGGILRANQQARKLLGEGRVLLEVCGRLSTVDLIGGAALRAAIERFGLAPSPGDGVPDAVSPIRLSGGAEVGAEAPAVLAHVLPLKSSSLGSGLVPRAVAAVVLRCDADGSSVGDDMAQFAAMHGLTPAEARVMRVLMEGHSITEVAGALDIAVATARTHLSRLFAKTGTRRQGELIALASRKPDVT